MLIFVGIRNSRNSGYSAAGEVVPVDDIRCGAGVEVESEVLGI